MCWLFTIDWVATFTPTPPILETVVPGTTLYLALVLLLRIVLKWEAGQLGMTDLLVLVLLGDASQNAMAGSDTSATDGLVLVLTLVCWSYALNGVTYRFRPIARLRVPRPLVRDGRMLRQNMRRELITDDEVMSQLRLPAMDDIARVRAACDGRKA